MKKLYYCFLFTIFALGTLESQAQMSANDVIVTVDYTIGKLRVQWPDLSGSAVCDKYAVNEKITYQVSGGGVITIFDNSTGGSSSANFAEFTSLPAVFFQNLVSVTLTGSYGNANGTCAAPLIPHNIIKQVNTRLENPQSLTATTDASCADVGLSWNAPSIVAGASLLRFDISRRNANTTAWTTVNANVSGSATTYSDAGAPAGIEQEYSIKTKMLYSSGRTALTNGATINGRRIGVAGTPTGIFIDQANCNGDLDVNWNWSNSNNPSNFEVAKNATSATSTNGWTTTVLSGADRAYRDNAATSGSTYHYKVRATAACPNDPSNPLASSYTTVASKTGLGVPSATTTSAIVVNTAAQKVTLTWVDNSAMEDGFKVVRTGSSGQVEFDVSENSTSYIDNAADICQNLTYQIKVYNSCRSTGVISSNSKSAYIPADISNVFNNSSNKVTASDGEFGDRIELKWSTPTRQVDDWSIYRINPLIPDTTFVASVDGSSRFYSDLSANANTLYEYLIEGVSDCAGNTIKSNTTKDVGFRLAFGTSNGQVTYDGGTAVENVKITAESASGASGFSGDFNGTSSYGNANNPTDFQTDSMTLTGFIRPNNLIGKKVIASKLTGSIGWEFFLQNSVLTLTTGSKTITATSPFIVANNWVSVAASVSGDTVKLYANGVLLNTEASNQRSTNTTSDFLIGKSHSGHFFKGQLDDLRFYNRALSNDEIRKSFDVYINPSQNGLVGYWRFDEGFGNNAYDYSKTVLTPNKNHASLVNVPFSASKPSTSQLTAGAYTDDRGSYFIPFIPFLGNGDNFLVTPAFGTHTFTPATTTLYIGGATPNFNNVNFLDNSSFAVTGSVKFKGSSCFVEGVFIKVDGEVVIQNGVPVQTDALGLYSMQVPIGPHVITAEKTNHDFSVGRFPSSGNYNFQQNENLNSFIDSTLSKVIGRVAGGGIQKSLLPGLSRGINNIGQATINFKSLQGNGCDTTTVTTDPITGEYEIDLPPLKFEVKDFAISSNASITFQNNAILDLFIGPPLQTETDTLFRDSVGVKKLVRIDSVSYNKQLDFIYSEAPILNVVDENFQNNYGADSLPTTFNNFAITVPTISLGLNYPVFQENQEYNWNILANEVYVNKDANQADPTTWVYDSVPLTDGKFIINNNLAVDISSEIVVEPQDNFDGTQSYTFVASQANISQNPIPQYNFTKTFEIALVTPTSTVIWKPNAGDGTPSPLFRGIIFGGKALGNSFATAGPQVVTMILRDPPGSNSFSTWGKETTHTTTSSLETDFGLGFNLAKNVKLGTSFTIGLGYATDAKFSNNLKLELEIQASVNTNNEHVESITRGTDLSTSPDPDFVGHNSDLFFGKSMNMDFGLAQVIDLIDTSKCGGSNTQCYGDTLYYNGNAFRIGTTKTMFVVPGGYGTEFVYSQSGIENNVIPRLVNLRDQILSGGGNYSSILPSNHVNYGKSNDDLIFGASSTPEPLKSSRKDSLGVSYSFSGYGTKDTTVIDTIVPPPFLVTWPRVVTVVTGVDSVWWYNRQIKLWEDALALNEKEKIDATSTTLDRNISYQAGSSITYTNSSTITDTRTRTYNFNLSERASLEIGGEVAGIGVAVTQSLELTQKISKGSSNSTGTTTTFSYTLDDQNPLDDFSVDVFNSTEGFGTMFKTRAGNTACPHQEEYRSKYHLPGTIIDQATVQYEQPRITASPSTIFNVPADGSAIINLNLINDGIKQEVYAITVLEASNPNGAILEIDGLSPNRQFAIPPQASLNKQLSISKGASHITYDSLAIVFHSTCQYSYGTANYKDIADTVYISVNFLPSCTDVAISNPGDQFVLNNSFNDTLPLILSGYDINYGGLEKIGLQFKPSSQSSWISLSEEWFFDTTNVDPQHPSPFPIPTNQSYISFNLDLAQAIDQKYQIRAFSQCEIPGNPDKITYSNVIGGIADRVNPHPFGTPSPADGVLDPNDDITIQFNESIESGSLTIDNFQLSGVVNGQEVRHDKTVSFDGATGYLQVANGFDFASGSFTVEFWAKRNVLGTNQVVISQGNTPNNLFTVGFNASNNVEVTVGNQTYSSTFINNDDSTWHHYTIAYDKPNLNLEIFDRSSSATVSSTNNNFFSSFTSGGKTYFGKNSRNNSEFFNGSAHQIRIWNRALSSSVVSSRLNVNLTGREPGLVGYWPMEEGRGNLAEDKARARNAEVYAQWEISPKSSSATFDGTNDFALLDSAGTLAVTSEMDLSVEFWFKTAGGSTMSMLSNGGGRFTPNGSNRNGWNIEMAADNTVHVKNDSTDFIAVSTNFADNNWHHFALVVKRAANATAYIDGIQQNTLSANNFYGFGAPRLAIGARYSINGSIETYDQHFNGSIDEIRIWNSARLKDNIELDMFNRLKGDEFGLLVYYPFEEYLVDGFGVPNLTPNFKDGSLSLLNLVAQNGALVTSAQSPAIALQRPVKNINFTWSVNNDKIVINTNEDPSNIENVTLNISVKNIKDVHGNKMQSPKTWIAYINKNQVKWQDVEKNLTKEFNDTLTFSTRVVNSGGQVKNYSISNIPAWLTVSPSSATINPQSTQAIRFTVNPALNIGSFTEDLLLTTDFGYAEKLNINLDVKKTAPTFTFDNSLYAKSMNIIGQIAVNGNISVNDEDILVAYINNEIRGKTNLRYVPSLDKYIGFLDVYSNSADSVRFKVWNASEGELHENVTPNLYFVENSLTGSILSPQIFDAVNNLSKPIVLNAGWNWVSFPLTDSKMGSLHSFFQGMSFATGDVVKTIGNNSFAQFGGPSLGWSGGLTRKGLNNDQSYLVYITNKDTIEYKGLAIDPDTLPISVVQGWNRIGFVSTKNIEINAALANLNATDGDLIKSQQAFAVYLSSLGWIGSLTTLEPTEGYLLKSASTSTFVYPRRGLLRIKEEPVQQKLDETLPALYSLNPNRFEASTNAIVKINTCEEVLENKDWALAAFNNDELRGWVSSTTFINEEKGHEYFITVFGEGNETYTFKMINQATGEQMTVNAKLDFEKNKVQGEVNNPLRFQLFTDVDCDQFKVTLTADEEEEQYSYPNPFSGFVTIVVPKTITETGQVEIIDKNGRIVFSRNVDDHRQWHLNGAELYFLANGVYTLKFTDGETVIIEKLVRIK